MAFTTDPNDPGLHKTKENGQNETYLILSDEERAKGYVRPLRRSYVHVGKRPQYPLRDLTPFEQAQYGDLNYVKFEVYPPEKLPITGQYWTADKLKGGCGTLTTMAQEFAETYARDPKFYGSTFCCGCSKHIAVDEFVWDGTEERVGS